jgi:uncharacterized protein (DUF1501 family)
LLARKLATPHLSIGIQQDGAVAGPNGDDGARTAAAAQAVTSGSNRVVTVEVASGLDTHGADWRSQHFKRLKKGFAAVAEMADRLAAARAPGGGSRLDHTMIFGFSELGRSPLLNAQGGRDHHLANGCFLLGGPAVGCRTLGATSDRGMEALPVNLANGRPDPSGRLLRPEHVLQALLQVAGSSASLGVPPLKWDGVRS